MEKQGQKRLQIRSDRGNKINKEKETVKKRQRKDRNSPNTILGLV